MNHLAGFQLLTCRVISYVEAETSHFPVKKSVRGAWVRQLNGNGRYAGKHVCEQLDALAKNA